jgi:hypothetical protein
LIIAGREVSLENKHLSLYEKYRARPASKWTEKDALDAAPANE